MRLHIGKFRPSNKTILTTAGVLTALVLAAAAGVSLRMLQNKDDGNQSPDTALKTDPLPAIGTEVQNLRVSGDPKADEVLNQALNDPETPDSERYMLYIEQGNALSDKQDYAGAVASYEKAMAVDETYEIIMLIAETWKQAGDKTKAIDMYKKALPLVPDTPMRDADKARIEDKIRALGGQV